MVIGDDGAGWLTTIESGTKDFLIDNIPLPRSANPILIDRGNATMVIPVTVERTFGSKAKCLNYFLTTLQTMPGLADITFSHSDGDGAISKTIPNMLIKIEGRQLVGLSCQFHYLLTGPGVTA